MVKRIPLTLGNYAIVDDEDYDILRERNWQDDSRGYATAGHVKPCGNRTTVKMHRVILGATDREQVDHINGLPWDNRRCNLRIVTNQQNSCNRGKYSTNKTGYKGVAIYKKGRFTAQITLDGRKKHLGCFDTAEEAATIYNEAARKYHGEYAKLNDI
jgi:hypothetical protein